MKEVLGLETLFSELLVVVYLVWKSLERERRREKGGKGKRRWRGLNDED